jgi:DNA-binding MarR family transcriptional regulator
MTDKSLDLTAEAVVEYTRDLFRALAERFGGGTTLNELRVMNQIIRCHLAGGTCSVTALHKVTGIPIATVSRAVANLQCAGWLADRPDPSDGRKRIITLGTRYLERRSPSCFPSGSWPEESAEHGMVRHS